MENNEMLADIRERIAVVETNQENINKAILSLASNTEKLVAKLNESDDIAKAADQRAKSAHLRIDDIKKDIEDIQKNKRWWNRLVIGGFITGIISIALNFFKEGFG
ncbi:hypothetical protein [Chengkuizengella axinellae]|uniref:Hemolysin XhlA n=1 Tax=Chengkuizengella axinellae TaxID=3064388 RepID=A0ABT9J2M2_9BACL|nr:hypothetical protein [Chengkuizengella sp. 2205SS18-9]MDP5275264.1 hypothetical protein [Chengkuizengella sp. 2205SS18-9]